MRDLQDIIEHNLKPDYKVLSDYVFVAAEHFFLGSVLKKGYHPKILRSDHDGVWEKDGTLQLCELFQKELAEENNGIKQNFEELMEVFNKPVNVQEKDITRIYRENDVNLSQIMHASYRAEKRFEFGKNSLLAVSKLQHVLGYHFLVYSGSFEAAIKQFDGHNYRYPLALENLWEMMGISRKQVNGSEIYCDSKGRVTKVKLMLEHKKGEAARKESLEPYRYVFVITDDIISDFSMMSCDIHILPIVMLTGKPMPELKPIRIPCQKSKKDKMELLKPILKVERGIVQALTMNKERVEQACEVANQIKELAEICTIADERDFEIQKEDYVNFSSRFLDLLTGELSTGRYSLFPERLTRVRTYLDMLRYTKDVIAGKELVQKTFNIMKAYSPEF